MLGLFSFFLRNPLAFWQRWKLSAQRCWEYQRLTMKIAEKLKQARKRAKLTQAAAAKLVGVSARLYWAWEAGKSQPPTTEQTGDAIVARLEKLTTNK